MYLFAVSVLFGSTREVLASPLVPQFVLPDLSGLGQAGSEISSELASLAPLSHGFHHV